MIRDTSKLVLLVLFVGLSCKFIVYSIQPYSYAEQSDVSEKNNSNSQETNKVFANKSDSTQRNLPEGAKRRLGKGDVTDMQLSPDGTRLAVASPLGVWLIDVETADEIALLKGFEQKTEYVIPRVIFSPDSKTIASSGYDGRIRIWNGKTGEHLLTINMPNSPATLYKFLSDGTWSTHIVPANQDIVVGDYFQEGETGSLQIVPGGPLKSLRFLNDSKTLMIQNLRGTIWLWNIITGEKIASYSPKLPIPKLEKYKTWLQMGKLPNPDKWQLETDAYVNIENDTDVTFAYSVGDKSGTIRIQDGHTDKEISILNSQKVSTKDTESPPIQDNVRRPGEVRNIPKTLPTDWVKWISKIKFSPDGKTLVSWSDYRMANPRGDGLLSQQGPTELWKVATGKRLRTLSDLESQPSHVDVEFSANGKTIAITREDNYEIWDVVNRREIASISGEINIKFSGNGLYFAIIGGGKLSIWEISTRRMFDSIETSPGWFRLASKQTQWTSGDTALSAISSDGDILAVLNRQGKIEIWKPDGKKKLKTLVTSFTRPITKIAFAHDSNIIASGDNVGNIQLWDLNKGTQHKLFTAGDGKPVGGLAFASDDTILTSESDGYIEVWDINSRKLLHRNRIQGAMGYGNIKMMVSDVHTSIDFYYGIVALITNGGKIAAFNDHESAALNETINVWDITTGNHLCTITDASIGNVMLAFSHDGVTLATGGRGVTYLWNVNTGERIATLNMTKKQLKPVGGINDIFAGAFTHDGKKLAVGGTGKEKAIYIWDITSQTLVATLKGHEHTISKLEFSPDDTILASGDASGKILLWNMPAGTHFTKFNSSGGYVRELVFSSDGKTLASTNGGDPLRNPVGTIFLWDIPSK